MAERSAILGALRMDGLRWIAACAALSAGAVLAQQRAHVHGVARLDAALDGPMLTLALEAPLDGLLGFERAPRSAAEQRAARELLERLRTDTSLLKPDPAAGCERTDLQIESAVLDAGAAKGAAGPQESNPDRHAHAHADLEATWTFRCRSPGQLGFVDVGLATAWPRIGRIEVRIAGPRGQSAQQLRRPATRVAWPR